MSIAANVASTIATPAPILPAALTTPKAKSTMTEIADAVLKQAPKPVTPRKVAARKVEAAAAAIAELIAPAPNAHKEAAPTKVEPRVEQGLVDAYLQAEAGVGDAAVALLYACLHAKVHPSQFGTNASAKVRASEFNTAYKAMRLLTVKGAKAVMDDAAKRTGERRRNIVDALRKAIAVGSQVKGSALKATDLAKQVAKAVNEANDAKAAAKAQATRAPRPAMLPASNSPKAVMPVILNMFYEAKATLGKVEFTPGQNRKLKDLLETIDEAIAAAEGLA